MDPLTIAGLISTGTGFLGQLFGKSEETRRAEQEKRNQEATARTLAFLNQQKQKTLSEGVRKIGQRAQGMVASSRSAAMQRAAAAGRSGEAESYVLPAEATATHAGNEAIGNFVTETNRQYDSAGINAQLAGLGESLQPLPEEATWADYAMPIGGALMRYGISKENRVPGEVPNEEDTTGTQVREEPNPLASADVEPGVPFRIGESDNSQEGLNPMPSDYNARLRRMRGVQGLRRDPLLG